ncbi:MAG: G1 family glutamic endopeptidase [Chthoniobacteraceae bacterium]
MKRISCLVAAAALATAAVYFRTSPAGSAQAVVTSRPVNPAHPVQMTYVLKPIPSSAVHHAQTGLPRVRLRESTSGNWSGYAVPLEKSGETDVFSDIQGTWKIPTVTGMGRSAAYSSAWIGIDGYEDGTVEQIGSEQDWTGTKQQNYVWFEMYPNGAYEITGFPASPGDSITAQVHYLGLLKVQVGRNRTEEESVFQLTIENNTRNVSYTVPESYTTIPEAELASAEWVMEAPTGRQVLPLANFGTINFSDCKAASLRTKEVLSPIDAWIPDPLTMVDANGGRAVPSALSANGEAFSATWSTK